MKLELPMNAAVPMADMRADPEARSITQKQQQTAMTRVIAIKIKADTNNEAPVRSQSATVISSRPG